MTGRGLHARRRLGTAGLALGLALAVPAAAETLPYRLDPNALAVAVNNRDTALVLGLIQAGADVHRPFADGAPLLNEAAGDGDAATLKALYHAGAGLEEVGPKRFTALMAAAHKGQLETAELLMDWGADRDAVDLKGMTALDYAAAEGHNDVRDALLERGVARRQPRSRGRDAWAGEAPDGAQAWMLAAFALWDQQNDDTCFCLGGDRRNQKMSTADFLAKTWDIHNRADALEQLRRLSDAGWNRDYFAKRAAVESWNLLELALHVILSGQDSAETRKALVVRRSGDKLGPQGILAWDLVRYLWIASHSYGAGYFSKEEAWQMMLPVACRLQSSYPSWKACQDSYLIGREYSGAGDADQDRLWNIEAFLLEPGNGTSPWKLHPWNQDLGCGAPAAGAKP